MISSVTVVRHIRIIFLWKTFGAVAGARAVPFGTLAAFSRLPGTAVPGYHMLSLRDCDPAAR